MTTGNVWKLISSKGNALKKKNLVERISKSLHLQYSVFESVNNGMSISMH